MRRFERVSACRASRPSRPPDQRGGLNVQVVRDTQAVAACECRQASGHRSDRCPPQARASCRRCIHRRSADTPRLTDSTDYVVTLLRARDVRAPHGRFRHDPSNPSVPVDDVAAYSHRVIRRICARVVGAVAVAARVRGEDALRDVQQIGVLCRNIPARSGKR